MSDDPGNKQKDGFSVDLNDPDEFSCFHSGLKKEFPERSDSIIRSAIREAAARIAPSRSREKLAGHVRQLLGH